MKRVKLGQYFEWKSQIVKCEWINEGLRSIGFKLKRKVCCPKCEHEFEIESSEGVIEDSPQFQNTAKRIETIEEE